MKIRERVDTLPMGGYAMAQDAPDRSVDPKSKLLDHMRDIIRLKHLSYRTEEAYLSWVKRFIVFHDKRHPKDMGATEIRAFLTHLAVHDKVAASTQNSALNALLFLYRHVLRQPFPDLGEIERAKRPRRVPAVFTQEEVPQVLAHLTGVPALMAGLLYGAGLRLMECVRLRVKDVDFAYRQITVRDGKGAQDRVTMLPQSLVALLQRHLSKVKLVHEEDVLAGYGEVFFPMPSPGKIRTPGHRGRGSMFSRPRSAPSIRAPGLHDVITSRRPSCKKPCTAPCVAPESRNAAVVTPYAIRLPPTCWKMAMTFAPFRNSWDTRMLVPP